MRGYTLIEAIISVLLLAIILLGGTTLFYQNLKSVGFSDVNSNLNSTLNSILGALEKDIRYGEVTNVGMGSRLECLTTESAGYGGTSLRVRDLNGHETVYSLEDDKVASTASETGQKGYLNSDDIKVETLDFTWFCLAGVGDKIKITIDASSNILSTGIKVEQNVSTEVDLLNSGLI